MDDLHALISPPAPTPGRPLLGCSILVVEDSRFACEAIRLMCLRSGARLRRADCLASARRHLLAYRPTILIADLGLPDGSGADLLADLDQAEPRIPALLAMSGDPGRRREAMNAGADDFIEKPVESLFSFQKLLVSHLPSDMRPPRLCSPARGDQIEPDPIAYHDDIAHACEMLGTGTDERMLDYILQFTTGVALSAHDTPLATAARELARLRTAGRPLGSRLASFAGILQERLSARQSMI